MDNDTLKKNLSDRAAEETKNVSDLETSPLTDGRFPTTQMPSTVPDNASGGEDSIPATKSTSSSPITEITQKDYKRGKNAPRRITLGSSVHLICLKDLAAKLGRPEKSVAALCRILEIPQVYIGSTIYFNEKALERMFYVMTKPGGKPFLTPGSRYKRSGKGRDGKITEPTDKQKTASKNPMTLLEMRLEDNKPSAKVIKNVLTKVAEVKKEQNKQQKKQQSKQQKEQPADNTDNTDNTDDTDFDPFQDLINGSEVEDDG